MSKIPLFSLKGIKYDLNNGDTLIVKKFEIHKGVIYALSGKPGAGKTALLNILARNIKPSVGDFEYDGKPYKKLSAKDYNNQFSVVPQSFKPPYFATVRDYFLKTFLSYNHIDDAQKRLDSICRKMDISDDILNIKMKHLSPGQLRWVLLAIGVGSDTKVLLIDEIEQHLPTEQLNLLLKVLNKKCNYDGVTMIITTQRTEILKKIASIFVNLENGKIKSLRSPNKKQARRPNKPYNKPNSIKKSVSN